MKRFTIAMLFAVSAVLVLAVVAQAITIETEEGKTYEFTEKVDEGSYDSKGIAFDWVIYKEANGQCRVHVTNINNTTGEFLDQTIRDQKNARFTVITRENNVPDPVHDPIMKIYDCSSRPQPR